jgi:hypothetical protein
MPKAPPAPLTAEQRQGVLQALGSAPAPQTATDLCKRLTGWPGLKRPQVEELLAQGVQQGIVFAHPGATAKGKPRFWHQDRAAWLMAPVRALLSNSPEPLTAADFAKQLTLGDKITAADVQPLLDRLCESGEVHRHLPKTAKGQPRFATRSPAELMIPVILRLVTAKGGLPLEKIVAALKGSDPGAIRQVVEQLRQERRLFLHPRVGKGQPLYKTTPVAPLEFLSDVRAALLKAVPVLQGAGVPVEELRRALVQLAAEAGIPLAGAGSAGTPAPSPQSTVQPPAVPAAPDSSPVGPRDGSAGEHHHAAVAAVNLVALMKQVNPGAELGALIGVAELRRRAGLSKEAFDREALALAKGGRVSLHPHDFPGGLTPERRAELITDGAGRYYVGLALRRGES